jgi:opacity protein-like surface antigen
MLRRHLPIAAALAVAALLPAAAAASPATSTPFTDSFSGTETGLVDDCTGATGGVLVGSGTVTGRVTEMSGGFVVHGVENDVVRIDFSDGSYFIGSSTDHFAFANPPSTNFVYTAAHEDHGTSYAADGSIRGSVVFRATEHTTITRDGNVRVSFERGRLTCS